MQIKATRTDFNFALGYNYTLKLSNGKTVVAEGNNDKTLNFEYNQIPADAGKTLTVTQISFAKK